ncbi:FadR/GntR family transcriptional regulator [Rhodococcus xishaensis]|uniref:FadR family transcriptional regulator n=1 Tax=Rhodococcus xishaensis TaxID=2487364 RepID=A0A3S3E4P7_9NOCA|nr:FadR/GntR family transcriptional regulator [Rhodococcus xishaensis]RVW05290.1 FadR family transcriptional regulator [Rhodococcus xishaensis]
MQPVRRRSLITQVTNQLREEIRSGRWPVGSRIPTESALAEIAGTGRNTVREAVQALVHAGLLERRQGSGTFVLANSEVGGTLGKFFASAQERDLMELRQSLDVTAARLAAQRRTDSDIQNLRTLLEVRTVTWDTKDLREAVAADVALHRGIVAASHNHVYLEFYDSLLPAIEATVYKHSLATGATFHAEHADLVEAIIVGDTRRAVRAAQYFFDELRSEFSDEEQEPAVEQEPARKVQ